MSAQPTVPTPASRRPVPTAVVIGAGVAGLTAAHELVERGFDVTVYEPKADERAQFDAASGYPPVKLGGLAASQFSTAGVGGGRARLRPFPGRRGTPRPPERAVAGEHGYRFFPAYYLHLGDLLERIPVYEPTSESGPARTRWSPTSRTVMDNMRRVVAQATTVGGKPSLIFPREAPRTLAEMLTATNQLAQLGFSPTDVSTFSARLLRYLVTSPLRRAAELEHVSAYDFFLGQAGGQRQFGYTPPFESFILGMPKVLAAFDSRWGDARTNLTTYLQLQMQMSRSDNKADGVLNGPTSESWFDHWYRHLARLGVRFVLGAAHGLEPPRAEATVPAHLRPRATVVLADGTRLAPDYVVVAADAPTAESITAPLRAAGTGGTVVGLDGFTTSVPPPAGPLQDATTRPRSRRDPLDMSETGRVPWDRFQTLAGIQYYFDTAFQLVRGHVYHSGSDWGLSSINQQGLWERRPALVRDGHVAVLSVDIGDFNTPSRHLLDAHGRGKAARDCTADELAAEVWRQIAAALTSDVDNGPDAILPTPAWYALDRNLVLTGAGEGTDRPIRNEAPYLVPIVGDWSNRPDGEPWNPNGSSWITRPTEDQWLEDLDWRHVWQARHGGYQVHHNSVVFAGTWTKTFTRMTSMEAACESGRHAVNAILDHYVWVETGGADRRESTTINWRFPFGFLDQGITGPVRLPSPAGDYCFVFDVENREPLETRALRNLDSSFFRASLPHPLDAMNAGSFLSAGSTAPPIAGGLPMTTPPDAYTGQLLTYLQAWRQYLEQVVQGAAGASPPATLWPPPAAPVAVPPPAPPPWPTPPPDASGASVSPPAAPVGLVSPWPFTPAAAAPTGAAQTGASELPSWPLDRPVPPAEQPPGGTGPAPDAAGRSSLYAADLAAPPSVAPAGREPGSAFRQYGAPAPNAFAAPAASSLYQAAASPAAAPPTTAYPLVQPPERPAVRPGTRRPHAYKDELVPPDHDDGSR